ncbi:hypothetical protein KVT40_006595 [Elsinoe batatas]|uniref:Uncharacterized protein n=1 Tax=Elsinoe batatas TaxID=2601811 RepID=A0A8K0KY88_9PEZI|nr:hypothetical protein KVT40_006595 [Elsinoe batatas]
MADNSSNIPSANTSRTVSPSPAPSPSRLSPNNTPRPAATDEQEQQSRKRTREDSGDSPRMFPSPKRNDSGAYLSSEHDGQDPSDEADGEAKPNPEREPSEDEGEDDGDDDDDDDDEEVPSGPRREAGRLPVRVPAVEQGPAQCRSCKGYLRPVYTRMQTHIPVAQTSIVPGLRCTCLR